VVGSPDSFPPIPGKTTADKRARRISSLPKQADSEKKSMLIEGDHATKRILAAPHALPDIGVDTSDILGLQAGDAVQVEAGDAKPGNHPQHGKLVGLNKVKFVVELENGLRVHFPKVGYFIKKSDHQTNGSK
jgi:sRNA-binding protein